jgi:surfeit locus 1 family protein
MTNSIDSQFRFRPALPQSAVIALLLPLLIALGDWQLQRAEEKQTLFAAIDTALRAPAQPVAALAVSPLPQHARAVGRYEPLPFLLDNRVRNGVAGYELLAPLRLVDGHSVLVVLGWLPQGADRAHLPSVTLPLGMVEVEGLAVAPAPPPFALSDHETFATGWPKVVQTAVPDRLSRVLGHSLLPLVIYPDGSEAALHEIDALHAFTPARHRAYAVQWFVMAGVLLVLYLRHGLRRGGVS